jgi:tripartite-type tricarboxylate transporter receptor subunit TctC
MRRLLLALSTALLCVNAASAQEDVSAFYKGKTIRLVVGIGVGSGYDINARVLARHMTKHIPGNPQIIVQNQPGAGSLTMTNQLYNIGPFDGTAMGATFNGLPTTPLLQPGGVRFDVHKINWVGSTNRETQAMYVWHGAPMKKLEDLRTMEMIVGAQAAGSTQYDYPMMGNALLGLKFKVITGYEATPKINLAMERGEVHGTWANWSTLKAISSQWLEEKKINILAQWALRKHPEMPNVPLIYDVAKTDEQKQALDLALARLEFGRPFFLPPGVPQARVDAIRKAFDATMKDPEFMAECDKLKIDIEPLSGVEVSELLVKIYKTPADTVERVRKSMEHK